MYNVHMDLEGFERVIAETLDQFPDSMRHQIANVAFVIEEWPDDDTLDMAEVDEREDLLGFYYGIPLTQRGSGYNLVLPDKISIFRQPILRTCHSEAEVRETIQHTVRHEIAHYFGIDDDRLEELGAY